MEGRLGSVEAKARALVIATPERRRKTRKRLLVGLIGATAILGSSDAYLGQKVDGDPLFVIHSAQMSQSAGAQAAAVPKSDYRAAYELFTHSKANDTSDAPSAYDFAKQQAEHSGLQLGELEPYQKELEDAGSIEEILQAANGFASQYNFSISMPESFGDEDRVLLSGEPVDITAQNKPQVKEQLKAGLLDLLDRTALVPKELIAYSRLRKVKIVGQIYPIQSKLETYGVTNPLTDIYYLTLSGYQALGSNGLHELGHLIEDRESGLVGTGNDPGFTALNPKNFKYGAWGGNIGGDVVTQYSAVAPVEDKANDFMALLEGYGYRPGTPIFEKLVYLAARTNQKIPGFAEYVARIRH